MYDVSVDSANYRFCVDFCLSIFIFIKSLFHGCLFLDPIGVVVPYRATVSFKDDIVVGNPLFIACYNPV